MAASSYLAFTSDTPGKISIDEEGLATLHLNHFLTVGISATSTCAAGDLAVVTHEDAVYANLDPAAGDVSDSKMTVSKGPRGNAIETAGVLTLQPALCIARRGSVGRGSLRPSVEFERAESKPPTEIRGLGYVVAGGSG
jgi:hypothetical protein